VDHLQFKIDLLFQAINELRIKMGYRPLRPPPRPQPPLPPSADEQARAAQKAQEAAEQAQKLALINTLEQQLTDLLAEEKAAELVDPDLDGFPGTAPKLPFTTYKSQHRRHHPPRYHHQGTPHGHARGQPDELPPAAGEDTLQVGKDGELSDGDSADNDNNPSPAAAAADDAVDRIAERLLEHSTNPNFRKKLKPISSTDGLVEAETVPSLGKDGKSSDPNSTPRFRVTGDGILFRPSAVGAASRAKQRGEAAKPHALITPVDDDGSDHSFNEDEQQVDENGEVSPVRMTVARTATQQPRFAAKGPVPVTSSPLARLRGSISRTSSQSSSPTSTIQTQTTPQSGGVVIEKDSTPPVEADTEIELRSVRRHIPLSSRSHPRPSTTVASSPSPLPSKHPRQQPVWLEDNFVDPELT